MEWEFAFSFALYAKGQNLPSMRYHFLSFLVFAAVPIANADATSKAVNETFSGYTDALASDDGAKAVDLLSSASKAYMENLVHLAKTADKETLDKQPLSVRMSALELRRSAREDNASITTLGEVVVLMSQGFGQMATSLSLGKVAQDGDSATAALLFDGNEIGTSIPFQKEEGEWKLDLSEQLKGTEKVFQEQLKESGLSENEFVLRSLGLSPDSPGSNAIWKPLE